MAGWPAGRMGVSLLRADSRRTKRVNRKRSQTRRPWWTENLETNSRQDDRQLSLTLFRLVFLKSRPFRLKNSPQRIARRSSTRIRPLRTLQSGGLKSSIQDQEVRRRRGDEPEI